MESGGFASNDSSGGGSRSMCSSVSGGAGRSASLLPMAVDRLCATVALNLFLLSIHLPGRQGLRKVGLRLREGFRQGQAGTATEFTKPGDRFLAD